MTEEEFRESNHIAGEISAHLYEQWCEELGDTMDFAGGKYYLGYAEDAVELGYPDDDDPYGPLVIRRESDGKWFEVEIEATVRPVPSAEERERQAEEARVMSEAFRAHQAGGAE